MITNGKYVTYAVDEKNGWSIPHWPQGDAEWMDYKRDRAYFCEHKWADTGMRKTFCKECDVDGELDPMTGQVRIIMKGSDNGK